MINAAKLIMVEAGEIVSEAQLEKDADNIILFELLLQSVSL